jgi:hypothetical protein
MIQGRRAASPVLSVRLSEFIQSIRAVQTYTSYALLLMSGLTA